MVSVTNIEKHYVYIESLRYDKTSIRVQKFDIYTFSFEISKALSIEARGPPSGVLKKHNRSLSLIKDAVRRQWLSPYNPLAGAGIYLRLYKAAILIVGRHRALSSRLRARLRPPAFYFAGLSSLARAEQALYRRRTCPILFAQHIWTAAAYRRAKVTSRTLMRAKVARAGLYVRRRLKQPRENERKEEKAEPFPFSCIYTEARIIESKSYTAPRTKSRARARVSPTHCSIIGSNSRDAAQGWPSAARAWLSECHVFRDKVYWLRRSLPRLIYLPDTPRASSTHRLSK